MHYFKELCNRLSFDTYDSEPEIAPEIIKKLYEFYENPLSDDDWDNLREFLKNIKKGKNSTFNHYIQTLLNIVNKLKKGYELPEYDETRVTRFQDIVDYWNGKETVSSNNSIKVTKKEESEKTIKTGIDNKYIKGVKISDKKFRLIVKCFSLGLDENLISEITNVPLDLCRLIYSRLLVYKDMEYRQILTKIREKPIRIKAE